MKRIVLIIIILVLTTLFLNSNTEDLIRIRVLANSNSTHDLEIKEKVSNNIKKEMYTLLKDETNINSARNKIKKSITNLSNIISNNIKNEEYDYSINYGLNYFPEKKYNNKIYKKGNYESLLVTLGEGKGDNWWCILFPPLCLIEAEESEEVEYNFFIKDIIDSILHL